MSDSTRDFLNYRVVEWQRNLPTRLQFSGVEDKYDPGREERGEYRLRLTLYLRANQMRILIHRKSAVRAGTEAFDSSSVNAMAELAKDTIRILVGLARDTDIYCAQHKTFNHFLEAALSALLLIICCGGNTKGESCLEEAHGAIELVRQLSTQSPITRRLRDKLQDIQGVVDGFRARNQVSSLLRTRSKTSTLSSDGRQDVDDAARDLNQCGLRGNVDNRPENTRPELAPCNFQTDPARPSFTNHNPGPLAAMSVASSTTTSLGHINESLGSSLMQDSSCTVLPGQSSFDPQQLSSFCGRSSHTCLDKSLPFDFDFSQADEYAFGDFHAHRLTEFEEILNGSGSPFTF